MDEVFFPQESSSGKMIGSCYRHEVELHENISSRMKSVAVCLYRGVVLPDTMMSMTFALDQLIEDQCDIPSAEEIQNTTSLMATSTSSMFIPALQGLENTLD